MIWERLDHLSSELIAEAERKFAVPSVPVVSVDLDSISCSMVQGVPPVVLSPSVVEASLGRVVLPRLGRGSNTLRLRVGWG